MFIIILYPSVLNKRVWYCMNFLSLFEKLCVCKFYMVLIMNHKSLIHVFLCFILFLGCSLFQVFGDNNYSSKNCVYPAIYNFGDSNSDTGAGYAAFYAANPPNGMNLFKNIPGRFSDGRVIVDFISKENSLLSMKYVFHSFPLEMF